MQNDDLTHVENRAIITIYAKMRSMPLGYMNL